MDRVDSRSSSRRHFSSLLVCDCHGLHLTSCFEEQSFSWPWIKNGSRRTCKYLTDLGYADDIAIFSDDAEKAQFMISSIETTARRVGLKINVPKTVFLLVGRWEASVTIRLQSGIVTQVDDFKYLGSWLMDCSKDFKVREALAWKACIRLVKIRKSEAIARRVKLNLHLACVESTLLYNAVSYVDNVK